MKILYLGDQNKATTSWHRASALMRLGNEVIVLDPYSSFRIIYSKIIGRLHYYTGYRFLQKKIVQWLHTELEKLQGIDLIWVNGGELFGPECVKVLKSYGCPVVLYNNDDPTGGRDGNRFASLLKAIPFYDMCVVMREINVAEYYERKAKKVLQVTMSYDEVVHKPYENKADIPGKFISEVVFIGTWMRREKRDVFLLELIRKGVPISIWGARWEKSPLWKELKYVYKGGAIGGRDYVAAIQGSKICLGLLSKGNRDYYTTRSQEIPYAGGLLCAERTQTHLDMYIEGEEAVFWSDVNECAEQCKKLLADPFLLERIQKSGQYRIKINKAGNQDICEKILKEVATLHS